MTLVTFIGTSGGRFATISQVRGTGGVYIEDQIRIHLDPGPGALVTMSKMGMDPRLTDVIVVSHGHPDHYGDADVLGGAVERLANHLPVPPLEAGAGQDRARR